MAKVDPPSQRVWVRILCESDGWLGQSRSIYDPNLLFRHTPRAEQEREEATADDTTLAKQHRKKAPVPPREDPPAKAPPASAPWTWGVRYHEVAAPAFAEPAAVSEAEKPRRCCFLCHFDEVDGICGPLRGFAAASKPTEAPATDAAVFSTAVFSTDAAVASEKEGGGTLWVHDR